MKKILAFLLMFVFVLPINVYASESEMTLTTENIVQYEYFDDGSYLVISFIADQNNIILDSRASDDYIVSGGKVVSYFDGSDNLDWEVTLRGEFLVVPSNSSLSGLCQSATLTYEIYDSSWHIYDIVEQEITNNACGFCTMKRKLLGITTKTVDVDLYITCDSYGNLK